MKSRLFSLSVVAVALVAVLALLLVSMPVAQQRAESDAKPTPRLSNGKPDFSGFYGGRHGDETRGALGSVLSKTDDGSIFFDYGSADGASFAALKESDNQPVYKPEYAAKVNALADTMYGGNSPDDPQMDCKPNGVPRAGVGGLLVHTPEALAILYEASPGPYWRVVYTDGGKHPERFDSSFFGHSIGHWEGDTLVVDTVGLNDETWLAGSQDGSVKHTTLHSDQMHVIERITRTGDTLRVEMTVEDPVMFAKPWIPGPRTLRVNRSGDFIQPQMCSHMSVDGRNRKEHILRRNQDPNDPDLKCGWCVSDGVYGGDSDLPTAISRQDEYKKLMEAGRVPGAAPGAK
jgi:hypothetical protein